eukprot:NODE_2665_length_1067_cov_6.137525_g2220_i0.p3 GENE.NODE_2665_length_1067_cov_6.137525_g2220_i0~~NODE_2665_length_1067_cov_6.137525_g2220_i0.p3  ORF type:complete len:145 (-),score=29.65 NODE_2665_length_1067_cov_6.137525_g2220_i0:128-562(-)
MDNQDFFGTNRAVRITPGYPKKGVSILKTKLFAGQLPDDVSEEYLRDLVGRFGTLTEVVITKNEQGKAPFAWIYMDSVNSCVYAVWGLHDKIKLRPDFQLRSGRRVEAKPMVLRFADDPESKRQRLAQQFSAKCHHRTNDPGSK